MADLALELAQLNAQARELLARYEESFARLDARSQEYAQQLAQQINDGLSALQNTKDGSLDAIVAKTHEGIDALQHLIDGGVGAKVVQIPTISGPQAASIGHQATWSFASESFLDEHVTIANFEVDWGDGNTETVAATNGSVTAAHTYNGNENDTYTIQVRAVDSIGNKSEPATASVRLVANQPPTAPTVDAPEEVTKNAQFSIKIHGSTDPDGDSVHYKIVNTGPFAFSKTDNIAENEEITVTAPDVNADTTLSFSVAAVDSRGLESERKIYSINVTASIDINTIAFTTPGKTVLTGCSNKRYAYIIIGGGGSGSCAMFPGGSSGFVRYGTFNSAEDQITLHVAPATPRLMNPNGENAPQYNGVFTSALKGYASSIVFSGGSIVAEGGWGNNTDSVAGGNYDLQKQEFVSYINGPHGFSGGGGAGNPGDGGKGGKEGNNGLPGATFPGGVGQGNEFYQELIAFANQYFPEIAIRTGEGGAASQGTHQGGGGAAGILIDGIEPHTPAEAAQRHDGRTPGQPGTGFGAGGGSAGYSDGIRGDSGIGASGLILLKEIK